MLFFIEDNGYGISVPGCFQTPGGNITDNLKSFKNLETIQGDGSDPAGLVKIFEAILPGIRAGQGPVLIRVEVPRLSGHSGQDTQSYKHADFIEAEKARDPLPKLKSYLCRQLISETDWIGLEQKAERDVAAALESVLARPEPDIKSVARYTFAEASVQLRGGLYAENHAFPPSSPLPTPEPVRINMLTAIRRTLEHELQTNPKVLVFGEDVGPKGGVHAATLGLQETFGAERVFDTSLSEEGIIGRSVGLALAGLMPVAEIQFRKYADPATEQLNNCGTIRWRTANRFAAPIVVRMPGGFAKCGDPWHSVHNEVMFAHAVGWQVAVPSNAEDAVGLLRTAMRSNNPTIFFEHRHLLDAPWARRPYPGDQFVIPFGQANVIRPGSRITVISWGAMVERAENAISRARVDAELIDLRTISPWDEQCILRSVKKTRRCLIIHEDWRTAGFGAEIAAVLAENCFFNLDAPIARIAVPDLPIPYNVGLMEAVLPDEKAISEKLIELTEI